MNAFHSLWTRPGNSPLKKTPVMEDFEILTMILSALKWREKNGSILMITDSVGKEFIMENGLSELWDLGIKDNLDDTISDDIDPYYFWAAGKLYALQMVDCPCVMLDTDFIVWEPLSERFRGKIIVTHEEELNPEVYPCINSFSFKDNYKVPLEWDWSVKACNTAFLYMPSREIRDYYVESATGFMKHVITDTLNPINAMCTAEQRFLPVCAMEKNVRIETLVDMRTINEQKLATHVWGYKRTLRQSYEEREEYCKSCISRIRKDFPEYEECISKNESFQRYYQDILKG